MDPILVSTEPIFVCESVSALLEIREKMGLEKIDKFVKI